MQYAQLGAALAGTAGQTIANVQASNQAGRIATAQAEVARQAGEANAAQIRTQASRILGKQQAVAGASGVLTSSGSPLDIMLESAKQAELQALTARQQGEVQAQQALYRGKVAKAGVLPAVGEGLVRGTTYFSDWWNKYGTNGKSTPLQTIPTGSTTGDITTRAGYQDFLDNPNRWRFK